MRLLLRHHEEGIPSYFHETASFGHKVCLFFDLDPKREEGSGLANVFWVCENENSDMNAFLMSEAGFERTVRAFITAVNAVLPTYFVDSDSDDFLYRYIGLRFLFIQPMIRGLVTRSNNF